MKTRFSWVATWGVVGFIIILIQAVVRLTPLALEPLRRGALENWQWALYAVSMAAMAYSEGYKGFQKQVAPRVAARAMALNRPSARLIDKVLAPLFCMALFRATRKRLITSWLVYAGIIVLIIIVRRLPQPYRGILDAGVVVGLTWGIVSILTEYIRVLLGKPSVDPELPTSTTL